MAGRQQGHQQQQSRLSLSLPTPDQDHKRNLVQFLLRDKRPGFYRGNNSTTDVDVEVLLVASEVAKAVVVAMGLEVLVVEETETQITVSDSQEFRSDMQGWLWPGLSSYGVTEDSEGSSRPSPLDWLLSLSKAQMATLHPSICDSASGHCKPIR